MLNRTVAHITVGTPPRRSIPKKQFSSEPRPSGRYGFYDSDEEEVVRRDVDRGDGDESSLSAQMRKLNIARIHGANSVEYSRALKQGKQMNDFAKFSASVDQSRKSSLIRAREKFDESVRRLYRITPGDQPATPSPLAKRNLGKTSTPAAVNTSLGEDYQSPERYSSLDAYLEYTQFIHEVSFAQSEEDFEFLDDGICEREGDVPSEDVDQPRISRHNIEDTPPKELLTPIMSASTPKSSFSLFGKSAPISPFQPFLTSSPATTPVSLTKTEKPKPDPLSTVSKPAIPSFAGFNIGTKSAAPVTSTAPSSIPSFGASQIAASTVAPPKTLPPKCLFATTALTTNTNSLSFKPSAPQSGSVTSGLPLTSNKGLFSSLQSGSNSAPQTGTSAQSECKTLGKDPALACSALAKLLDSPTIEDSSEKRGLFQDLFDSHMAFDAALNAENKNFADAMQSGSLNQGKRWLREKITVTMQHSSDPKRIANCVVTFAEAFENGFLQDFDECIDLRSDPQFDLEKFQHWFQSNVIAIYLNQLTEDPALYSAVLNSLATLLKQWPDAMRIVTAKLFQQSLILRGDYDGLEALISSRRKSGREVIQTEAAFVRLLLQIHLISDQKGRDEDDLIGTAFLQQMLTDLTESPPLLVITPVLVNEFTKIYASQLRKDSGPLFMSMLRYALKVIKAVQNPAEGANELMVGFSGQQASLIRQYVSQFDSKRQQKPTN